MKGERAYLVESGSGKKAKLPKSAEKYIIFDKDDVAHVTTKGSSAKNARACSDVMKHGWKSEEKSHKDKEKKRKAASPVDRSKMSRSKSAVRTPRKRCRTKTTKEEAARTPGRSLLKGMKGKVVGDIAFLQSLSVTEFQLISMITLPDIFTTKATDCYRLDAVDHIIILLIIITGLSCRSHVCKFARCRIDKVRERQRQKKRQVTSYVGVTATPVTFINS